MLSNAKLIPAILLVLTAIPAGTARGQAPFPPDLVAAAADPASVYYDPNAKRADDFVEPEIVGPIETDAPPPVQVEPVAPEAPEAPVDPLETARARRNRAFSVYTRLVTSDEQGDVEAALAEYKAAVEALEKLEKKEKKPKRKRR